MNNVLKLADLEVPSLVVPRAADHLKSIKIDNADVSYGDITQDYNESGSAGSFTPLPSI